MTLKRKERGRSIQIPSESAEEITVHAKIVRTIEPPVHSFTRGQLTAQLTAAIRRRCWWAEDAITLNAADAVRIEALLEARPGPTPAMLAMFCKAAP